MAVEPKNTTTEVENLVKPATSEVDQNGNSEVKLNGEADKEPALNGQ